MKIFKRFAFFSLAFVLGTQLTQLISSMDTTSDMTRLPAVEEPARFLTERAPMPLGVTVTYAGLQKNNHDGPYLKFIVHNGTNAPVSYGAQGPYSPIPDVLIDRKRQPEGYRCVSGSRAYSIEPKMSAEFRVREVEFEGLPRSNAVISVGFYLRDPHSDFGTDIFSEPFVIPEKFRDSIKEWRNLVDTRWAERDAK